MAGPQMLHRLSLSAPSISLSVHAAGKMKHARLRNVQYFTSCMRLQYKKAVTGSRYQNSQFFHCSARRNVINPLLLADIGEGITECQIVEWFVQPGDRVEEFDKLCEVQSDKASVEITSRYDGIIKELHYGKDDMAAVGKPLLEIDVEEDEVVVAGEGSVEGKAQESPKIDVSETTELQASPVLEDSIEELPDTLSTPSNSQLLQKRNNTATPAVRHLLNKLNLDIADIKGSGKGGRVSKEDIDRHVLSTASTSTPFKNEPTPVAVVVAKAEDRMSRFSSIQAQMFKTMTRSATIPHFLYTHTVDLTALSLAKTRYNSSPTNFKMTDTLPSKLTALPFIMKALSQAFAKFPALNAYLDSESPQLIIKGAHNFGIAVDTPQGLLVPVVKDVQTHSIISLAGEIGRLSKLAKAGKLTPDDSNGATFIVSNIGSIGGGVVAPVIVAPMVGILGVGKMREVPVFKKDEQGVKKLVERDELVLSWSADHRVLDGATVARCAEEVRTLLEDIDVFSMVLR